MNENELKDYLHHIEPFEQDSYKRYQAFFSKYASGTEDEVELQVIRKRFEEHYWDQFKKNNFNSPIILSYTEGRQNQLVMPVQSQSNETIWASRSLNAENEGIRKWMMIQKHPRFSPTFEHAHSFVEINYCYSGTVPNFVNGHPYMMHPGDLLIMEPGCFHSMGLVEEDDILINMVLFPSAMVTLIDKVIPGESELSRFLMNSLKRGFGKNNFVSIRTGENSSIVHTFNEIICEYLDENRTASEAITGFLVQELFARLWRLSEEQPERVEYGYAPDNKAVQILEYIRKNAVDCTRDSVARHFGYSGSRISNLLTEQFGKSFVALRNEIRLELIDKKLRTTDLPVQEIAEQFGISNQTHFYRMYREYFGHLPRKE